MLTTQQILDAQSDLYTHLNQAYGHWQPPRPKLLGLPPIIPGEVFSSWLTRVIVGGYVSKTTLLKKINWSRSIHLMDICLEHFDLNALSLQFNQKEASDLFHAFLNFDEPLPFAEKLCLTADVIKKQPIYRFCPTCLKNDDIPFIRKKWRMASTFSCDKHQSLLLTACTDCGHPIDPQHLIKNINRRLPETTFRFCHHCNADLASQATVKLTNKYAEMFRAMNNLSEVLMRIITFADNSFDQFTVGIHGPSIFGENTEAIKLLFQRERQYLDVFWHEKNEIYRTKRLPSIQKANKWVEKQLK